MISSITECDHKDYLAYAGISMHSTSNDRHRCLDRQAPARQKHMLYPEVSVEDAQRVAVGQAVQQLREQLPRLRFGHAPALAPVCQAACAGVLHLADITDISPASPLC